MRSITPELQEVFKILCVNNGQNVDIFEHIPTLRNYAEQCNHVTEFGVRWVVSTWALLAGKPAILRSYDKWHPSHFGNEYKGRIERVERVAKENDVDYKFIVGDTLKISIDETDLLFIDTLHTYMQLKGELALHASKVNKYIILHDTTAYAHRGMGPELGGDNVPKGLWDASIEFMAQNPQWKVKQLFQNNSGMAVLEKT